jgi:hypothetical protein
MSSRVAGRTPASLVTGDGGRSRYARGMAHRVWTAAELEQLSPAEQDEIFAAGIVRDLAAAPPEFLARVRARFEDHLAGTESPTQ